MKIQLLCTFTNENSLDSTVGQIIKTYKILFNKIYVFVNTDDESQLICTYNVEKNNQIFTENTDTISLHRKKQTNTLYTINALNTVIRNKNNGVLDKSYSIDWSEFQNSLLLTNNEGLSVIPTKIHNIIQIDSWRNE